MGRARGRCRGLVRCSDCIGYEAHAHEKWWHAYAILQVCTGVACVQILAEHVKIPSPGLGSGDWHSSSLPCCNDVYSCGRRVGCDWMPSGRMAFPQSLRDVSRLLERPRATGCQARPSLEGPMRACTLSISEVLLCSLCQC